MSFEYAATRLTTEVSRTFKPTHVQTLIAATYSSHTSMSELFRILSVRLRDERWICIFKTLSLIHLLTREGNSDRILGFLCGNTEILNRSFYQQQGFYYGNQAFDQTKWIKSYSQYLEEKAASFRQTKFDWIRHKDEAVAKFRTIEDVTELLKQTEVLQEQIDAACECKWEVSSMSDIVLQQGFRLMIAELIGLFHLGNEANVRILSLYFEMERPQATKALELYKKFTAQSKKMQEIFEVAKQNRHSLNLTIPVFKSPPASLATTLEDYLNAPDFEAQRRAYKEKKSGKKEPKAKAVPDEKPLIDWFSEVHNQTDEPQQNYNMNSYWDPSEEFSKQAALQQSLQDQLQQTNMLVHSVQSQPAYFSQQANPRNSFQAQLVPQQQTTTQNSFSTQAMYGTVPPSNSFVSIDPFAAFSSGKLAPATTTSPPTNQINQISSTHNPFAASSNNTSYNPAASPPMASLSPPMNQMNASAHNPFAVPSNTVAPNMSGAGNVTGFISGTNTPAFNSSTMPFGNSQSNAFATTSTSFGNMNTNQTSKFADPSFNVENVFGPGSPVSNPVAAFGSTSQMPISNDPFTHLKNSGMQPLQNQLTGSSVQVPFIAPQITGMTNFSRGTNGNPSPFSTPQLNNPYSQQMTGFSNSISSTSGTNNHNPFTPAQPTTNTNIFGNGMSGSNQGSILDNYHAPNSTKLNSSLGTFSSPNPMQDNQFPRSMNPQQPMMNSMNPQMPMNLQQQWSTQQQPANSMNTQQPMMNQSIFTSQSNTNKNQNPFFSFSQ